MVPSSFLHLLELLIILMTLDENIRLCSVLYIRTMQFIVVPGTDLRVWRVGADLV